MAGLRNVVSSAIGDKRNSRKVVRVKDALSFGGLEIATQAFNKRDPHLLLSPILLSRSFNNQMIVDSTPQRMEFVERKEVEKMRTVVKGGRRVDLVFTTASA